MPVQKSLETYWMHYVLKVSVREIMNSILRSKYRISISFWTVISTIDGGIDFNYTLICLELFYA